MFVSVSFVLFIAIFWLIYILIPGKMRKLLLCLVSLGFCGFLAVNALVALMLSTIVVYAGALLIEKCGNDRRRAKAVAGITAFLFAVVLVVVKNIPYVIKTFGISFFAEDHWMRTIVLPIGFSFYAFQAIGYIYEVYQGREKAEKDIIAFSLYMGFFAKLVSGPIERKGAFAKQIEKLANINIIDSTRISGALTYMAWGYFLKLVVADRLALIVNQLHNSPSYYDSLWLIAGAVFYSFQVYTDFAGYTCIAMGCASLFGIELTQNFLSPYCAVGITDFWRRWHITLSSWLRDYVYIPLGGNRKGVGRKYINTMIVFILCGIWHGNGVSFVVWGLLHGVYSIIDSVVAKKYVGDSVVRAEMLRIITFVAVTFAWIFFRADSLAGAGQYISNMCTKGIDFKGSVIALQQGGVEIIQFYLSCALVILVQFLDRIGYKEKCVIPDLVQKNRVVKYAFVYVCLMAIFVFGIYGGTFEAENFIYMQF